MQRHRQILIRAAWLIGAAAAGGCVSRPAGQTAPVVATHPLDPLTEPEFAVIRALVRQDGRIGPGAIAAWEQLLEPPKAEVLAYAPGQPFRREALVVMLSPAHHTAYEARVDLRRRVLESVRDLGNLQPFTTSSDEDAATLTVDQSPEIRAALERRGFRLEGRKISDRFYLDLYAPGRDLVRGADGIMREAASLTAHGSTVRAIRVLFADRQEGKNDYGPYVEGLMALIDVYGKKVVELDDRPAPHVSRRIPEDVFDRKVMGGADRKPLAPVPADPARLGLAGNHVAWHGWDFRYGFNEREGLVLYQIAHQDGPRLRSICYRAAVSEMLVPYADPSEGWLWREFFDAGEYGLGWMSSEANAGKELPVDAITVDAVFPDAELKPSRKFPNRVFFFERDGGALFAHTQSTDGSRVYARAKELVVGFVATVGNYDYVYQWIFRQDGSFGFEAELEGLTLNRTVADERCEICAGQAANGPGTYLGSGDQTYGTLVSPGVLAVFHQHWINLRLDFDIDRGGNAVKEIETVPVPLDPSANARGRAFTTRTTVFGRSGEAQRTVDPAANRCWEVFNPSERSPLGHAPGYEIVPGSTTSSAIPASRWGDETSFIQRHFWVTRYQPGELYAAGMYPNQAPAGYADHLLRYSEKNDPIYNEDVVVWYNLGFTHVTRPEDFPLMPGVKVGVDFVPEGFFERSPATPWAILEPKRDRNP